MEEFDLLILGAGWTSHFLIPLLKSKNYTFAATTTTGHDDTIPFRFEPDSANWRDAFDGLPHARYVLVTFPVLGAEAASKLVEGYRSRHRQRLGGSGYAQSPDAKRGKAASDDAAGYADGRVPRKGAERWILLGSTGVWQPGSTRNAAPSTATSASGPSSGSSSSGASGSSAPVQSSITACGARAASTSTSSAWITRHSPIDPQSVRGKGEAYFLDGRHVSPGTGPAAEDTSDAQTLTPAPLDDGGVVSPIAATVLNLAGLWGGQRDPRSWVERVARDRTAVTGKASLHLVHGADVAGGIVGVIAAWDSEPSAPASTNGDDGGKNSKFSSQRWMLTDGFVYDWWTLMVAWAPEKQGMWAREAMRDAGVRALPRAPEALGRAYDSREFWEAIAIWPGKSALSIGNGSLE